MRTSYKKSFFMYSILGTLFTAIFLCCTPVYSNSHLDLDQDRDIDGKDLAELVLVNSNIEEIAQQFGSNYRSFYMAATPFRFETQPYYASVEFIFEGFENNVDMVSLHMDGFFGLPWDEFKNNSTPNQPWYNKMQDIKERVNQLGTGIYLSLTPLSGMRDSLGSKAVDESGTLKIQQAWYAGCYDFDADPENIREAYLNYVTWMVDFFQPDYLTHGIEINLYLKACPDTYDSLVRLLNEVYDREKARQPSLPIFPSFTAAAMWGYGGNGDCSVGERTCLIENISRQSELKRDRWGISAYPVFQQWEWNRTSEQKMPTDYFSAFQELTGEHVVFAETGRGSYNVIVPYPELTDPCLTLFTSSNQDQQDYINTVMENANAFNSDLVVWWSLRDFLFHDLLTSCPYEDTGVWGAIYKTVADQGLLGAWIMWGSMGVLDFDAEEKPSYSTWKSWIDLPVIPYNP